jgi:hypothetical protein
MFRGSSGTREWVTQQGDRDIGMWLTILPVMR